MKPRSGMPEDPQGVNVPVAMCRRATLVRDMSGRRGFLFRLLGVGLIVLGLFFLLRTRETSPVFPEIVDQPSTPTPVHTMWGEGIERVTYAYSTTTRAKLELFGFTPSQYHVVLRNTSTGMGIGDWMEEQPAAIAGINGVYFHEDFTPSGLLVINGEENARRFDWDKSGLIMIDEKGFEIRDTAKSVPNIASLQNAAQSYPFLIRDGAPAVSEDSGLTARRSFIGTDKDGRVWIGILPNGELSLYELARRLAELEISWEHVLNLDGGPSSGLFVRKPYQRAMDAIAFPSYTGVPNVVVIEERQ